MPKSPRRARVRAFAKINLSLLVLGKRADGYHELRTIFQTISLADELEMEFAPSRSSSVAIESSIEIANNLAVLAAARILDEMRVRGSVRIRLKKRIPLGGGLGGGSSDAAAVLLTLPPLAGGAVEMDRLRAIAAELGSDVPFFLEGGTCLGLGRGEEIYPLPSLRSQHVLVVAPGTSVSTAEAYRALAREPAEKLTLSKQSNKLKKFQSLVSELVCPEASGAWKALCENDFEPVVFRQSPSLRSLHGALQRLQARPARMSGSGSALVGVFESRADLDRSVAALGGASWKAQSSRERPVTLERVSLVSRERYRRLWLRALEPYVDGNRWPPQGR